MLYNLLCNFLSYMSQLIVIKRSKTIKTQLKHKTQIYEIKIVN